jgi:hypothetical protein
MLQKIAHAGSDVRWSLLHQVRTRWIDNQSLKSMWQEKNLSRDTHAHSYSLEEKQTGSTHLGKKTLCRWHFIGPSARRLFPPAWQTDHRHSLAIGTTRLVDI